MVPNKKLVTTIDVAESIVAEIPPGKWAYIKRIFQEVLLAKNLAKFNDKPALIW